MSEFDKSEEGLEGFSEIRVPAGLKMFKAHRIEGDAHNPDYLRPDTEICVLDLNYMDGKAGFLRGFKDGKMEIDDLSQDTHDLKLILTRRHVMGLVQQLGALMAEDVTFLRANGSRIGGTS